MTLRENELKRGLAMAQTYDESRNKMHFQRALGMAETHIMDMSMSQKKDDDIENISHFQR